MSASTNNFDASSFARKAYHALRECGGPPHKYVDPILKAAGIPEDQIASVLEKLEEEGQIDNRLGGFSINLGNGRWLRGSRVKRWSP